MSPGQSHLRHSGIRQSDWLRSIAALEDWVRCKRKFASWRNAWRKLKKTGNNLPLLRHRQQSQLLVHETVTVVYHQRDARTVSQAQSLLCGNRALEFDHEKSNPSNPSRRHWVAGVAKDRKICLILAQSLQPRNIDLRQEFHTAAHGYLHSVR